MRAVLTGQAVIQKKGHMKTIARLLAVFETPDIAPLHIGLAL